MRKHCAFGKTIWSLTCLRRPATNWHEAAEKARYLLNLFAATLTAHDPRKQKLIAAVLADFKRLSGES